MLLDAEQKIFRAGLSKRKISQIRVKNCDCWARPLVVAYRSTNALSSLSLLLTQSNRSLLFKWCEKNSVRKKILGKKNPEKKNFWRKNGLRVEVGQNGRGLNQCTNRSRKIRENFYYPYLLYDHIVSAFRHFVIHGLFYYLMGTQWKKKW